MSASLGDCFDSSKCREPHSCAVVSKNGIAARIENLVRGELAAARTR